MQKQQLDPPYHISCIKLADIIHSNGQDQCAKRLPLQNPRFPCPNSSTSLYRIGFYRITFELPYSEILLSIQRGGGGHLNKGVVHVRD